VVPPRQGELRGPLDPLPARSGLGPAQDVHAHRRRPARPQGFRKERCRRAEELPGFGEARARLLRARPAPRLPRCGRVRAPGPRAGPRGPGQAGEDDPGAARAAGVGGPGGEREAPAARPAAARLRGCRDGQRARRLGRGARLEGLHVQEAGLAARPEEHASDRG